MLGRVLKNCEDGLMSYDRGPLNWYMVCLSQKAFNNTGVLPLLISTGIIPMAFLLVRQHGNNTTGMMVSTALALDPTFLIFDSSPEYAQTWTLLFLASLYMIGKNAYASIILFIGSICAKAIPLAWVPFILIYLGTGKTRHKGFIAGSFGIIFALVMAASWLNGGSIVYSSAGLDFDYIHSVENVLQAFRWEPHLVAASFVLLMYYFMRKLPKFPLYVLAASFGTMFMISIFSNDHFYYPYRAIPNIIAIFYACAFAMDHFCTRTIFKTDNPKF